MRLQNQAQRRDGQHAVRCANGSHWSVCVLSFYAAFRSIKLLTVTERYVVVLNAGWDLRMSGVVQWKSVKSCLQRNCSPRKQVTPLLSFFLYHRALINSLTRWNLLILCPHIKTKALPKSENETLLVIQNNTRCSDGRANNYFILREMFS